MQNQNCLLQKFVEIHIHLYEISLIPDLVYLCTSNDNAEKYTGKHVELIVARNASTETAHFITKQENYLLSY